MNLSTVILIISVAIAVAGFLFGQGVVARVRKKRDYIFCGIEVMAVQIPTSLRDEMKSVCQHYEQFWLYNVFAKNDSNRACMNPILTISIAGSVVGHVVNDTNEDKKEVEQSLEWREPYNLLLKLKRLGPKSFVDFSVWVTGSYAGAGGKCISLASDSDFELRTKLIRRLGSKDRFR